jgi:phytoene dehydrogenase-like protein
MAEPPAGYKPDALVVGGGIAGLAAALRLQNGGLRLGC